MCAFVENSPHETSKVPKLTSPKKIAQINIEAPTKSIVWFHSPVGVEVFLCLADLGHMLQKLLTVQDLEALYAIDKVL